MRITDTYVTGLGVYLPERVTIEQAIEEGRYPAEQVATDGLVSAAVAGDVPAPEMALNAARDAVKRSGAQPEEMDLLLYANSWQQGPEGWLPCSYLQHHLTGGDVLALELRQGCNGMFAGFEVAAGYLHAEPERRHALLVAADNFGTPLIDRWKAGPFVLGDAAASIVLSKDPGFARLLSVCSTTVVEAEESARGGQPLFPPSITLGHQVSFGAMMRNPMDMEPAARATMAAGLMKVHRRMVEIFQTALSEAGIGVDDITRMAVVNNTREMVEKRQLAPLGVDIAKSSWEFGRTVGHCGASDQILTLEHMITEGELKPGDHFVMFGMGPGVILACAVFEITDVPSWL